jgi:hypothetical protein
MGKQMSRPVLSGRLISNEEGKRMAILKGVQLSDLEDFKNDGIHQHIMRLACYCRGAGANDSGAVDLIHQKFNQSPQRRQLQPREVERAVERAFGGALQSRRVSRGVILPPKFEKITPESVWNRSMPLPSVEANQDLINEAVRATKWSLDDMWEESPLRVDECPPAELLSLSFSESDLLCCGSINRFMTLSVKDWLSGNYWMGDQVVPNPCRVRMGVTLGDKNKLSAHSRDATGKRKYIVVESDDEGMSFDAKASILLYLKERAEAKLRMVVHTAGKSLHGWFIASPDESVNWRFMKLACLLGADPRMWLPEQLARLPNAVRLKNQLTQKTYYFDPS